MLQEILAAIKNKKTEVDAFFSQQQESLKAPFYLSCDIRNSGFKIAVVDTNIFPAGFNNLCKSFSDQTINAIKSHLQTNHPQAKNIILLVEEHTRNRFYLENVHRLADFIRRAGYTVAKAYLGQTINDESLSIDIQDQHFNFYRLKKSGDVFFAGELKGDLIISNNDFSAGYPEILQDSPIPVIPHPGLGWWQRKKSSHFKILNELNVDFAKIIGISPDLISTFFASHDNSDLTDANNLQQLSQKIDQIIATSKTFYQQSDNPTVPYVFVKNNSGTYGMGIHTFYSGEEAQSLNKKLRNKLMSAKGGNDTSEFFIQEGIPTADTYSDFPIEPVIYNIGFEPVGGFFRVNTEKDTFSNLNAQGMFFSCLCLHKLSEAHEEMFISCKEKQALVEVSYYLARLAAIAVARENQLLGE